MVDSREGTSRRSLSFYINSHEENSGIRLVGLSAWWPCTDLRHSSLRFQVSSIHLCHPFTKETYTNARKKIRQAGFLEPVSRIERVT